MNMMISYQELVRTFLRQTFESMPFIKLELSENFLGLDRIKNPLVKVAEPGCEWAVAR